MNILFDIASFFISHEGQFSIRDFFEFTDMQMTPEKVKETCDILIYYDIGYMLPTQEEINLADYVWIKKEDFFNGKQFLVAPTEFEVENGVLILGSRFTWAGGLNKHSNYTDIIFDSKKLKHSTIEIHNKFANTYYFLFDEDMLINELCGECEENIPRVTKFTSNTFLYVTCLNINHIYESLNFKVGDRLIFEIKDYKKNIIELVPKKAPEVNQNDITLWKEGFNKATKTACEILGPDFLPQTIIGFAFFLGVHTIFGKKNIALEEALFENEKIKCMNYGFKSIIWTTDSHIPIPSYWSNSLPNPTGMIERFFFKIQMPITKEMLEDFVYDFLANNYMESNDEEKVESFSKDLAVKLVPKIKGARYKKQLDIAQNFILEVYESSKKHYNRFSENDTIIEFRSKVNYFLLDVIIFVNSLVKKNLYPNSFIDQTGLMLDQMLCQAIDFSNSMSTVYKQTQDHISEYMISLDNSLDMYESVKTEIINQINIITKE
ncbi:MAG: hypothetical protein CR988_06970 [Treponema sp.]|nr:MAG: hypothetical protein CR988_06970 [Treponema sp.]